MQLANDPVNSLDYRSARPSSTAEILLWQARIRLVAGILLGVVAAVLQVAGALPGAPSVHLQAMVAYIAAVSVISVVVRETLRVSTLVIAGTLLADAFLVFATTVIILPPGGYAASLLLSFLGLHLAVYAFGAGVGMLALAFTAVGHALMTWYAGTWGAPVSPEKVREAFKANPDAKVLAFVHAETSTGAQSDAAALAKIAQEYGALTIMDCVTSLGGTPIHLDQWGIAAAYSGSQKCLSCTPGLSPVSFSQKAIDRIQARKTPVQSWFLDLNLVLGYWQSAGKRTYHHTAPINPMYGLHEALVILEEEGLENAWVRHHAMHEKLKAGLEGMGLQYVVEASARLPQLNSVYVPEGVDDAAVRAKLLADFNLEIGAGLGDMAGKIWRIGLMGYSARQENVDYCLDALKACLK
mgnify:CR=1 FL=1